MKKRECKHVWEIRNTNTDKNRTNTTTVIDYQCKKCGEEKTGITTLNEKFFKKKDS